MFTKLSECQSSHVHKRGVCMAPTRMYEQTSLISDKSMERKKDFQHSSARSHVMREESENPTVWLLRRTMGSSTLSKRPPLA